MRVILMRVAGFAALALVGVVVFYQASKAPAQAPTPAPAAKVTEARKPPANPIREITSEPVQVAAASPSAVPLPHSAEAPPAPAPAPAAAPDATQAPIMAQAPAPTPAPAAAPAAPPPPTPIASCPGNPNALGVTRIVEVDTTGGPG